MNKLGLSNFSLDTNGLHEYDKNEESLNDFIKRSKFIKRFNLLYCEPNGGQITFSGEFTLENQIRVIVHFFYCSSVIRTNDYISSSKIIKSYDELNNIIPKLVLLQQKYDESSITLEKMYNNIF